MTKSYERPLLEGDGCEAARIGRALAPAYNRMENLWALGGAERRRPPNKDRRNYVEEAERHADGKLQALRLALSCHQATSLEGCIAQVVQALSLVDMIVDSLTPDDPKDVDLYQVKADRRALDRLLYSVLNHLEAVTGCDAENQFGADNLAPDHFDPWRLAEERLELTRS